MEATNPNHLAARRARRLAVPLALALLATGCAARQKQSVAFWPPPPEKARIQYIRSFRNRDQLDPGLGRRIANAVFPHDNQAAIVSPSGLALSPDERRLYVACGGSGRIIQIDRDRKTFTRLAANAKTRPSTVNGIAVDADENVYVADRVGEAIFVYSRRGEFLRKFGEKVLQTPTAVAIDRRAQLLYVIAGTPSRDHEHRVEVFSLAGQHLRTIGKRGGGPGEFNFPTALAVARDGTLYVSDMLNFRIQQFDRNGQLLSAFGQIGTGMVGAFDKIKGIAFDTFDNIYVVDTPQGVQILSPDHGPLLLFGQPPFMNVPGPIVIDSKNRIFVADFGLNGVHEFQLINTTAHDADAPPSEGAPAPTAAPPSPPAVNVGSPPTEGR